jgi:hypothetical protein
MLASLFAAIADANRRIIKSSERAINPFSLKDDASNERH